MTQTRETHSQEHSAQVFADHIAWIGLGAMGAPMARNLARKGFSVTAYNRTPREVDLGGCRVARSIVEAVADADIAAIMVSDGAAVREVLFGDHGAAPHLKPGALVVNHSTIGVDETKQIALELADRGIEFMDAPVSGSVKPAEEGQLVVLAGGSDAAFQRMQPVFAAIARKAYHLGPVGSGAAMKLLVNAYLGVIVEAAGECMAAADKSGLGRDKFLEVLADTGMWAPILAAKREMWRTHRYPSSFALKHMVKDLGLTGAYLTGLSVAAPSVLAALTAYLSAQAHGYANDDMAAVTQALSAAAGVQEGS